MVIQFPAWALKALHTSAISQALFQHVNKHVSSLLEDEG